MLYVFLLITVSGGASSREPDVVANVVYVGVAELRPPIAARTAGDEDVAVDLHHFLCRHSSARVQIVHVLGNEQEILCVMSKSRDRFMRSVRLCIANALPPLAIPIPN